MEPSHGRQNARERRPRHPAAQTRIFSSRGHVLSPLASVVTPASVPGLHLRELTVGPCPQPQPGTARPSERPSPPSREKFVCLSPPCREKFVSPVTTSRSVLPKTMKDQKIARGKREETNRNRNKPQHRLRVRARLRRVFTTATEQRAPPFERQIWVCRAECAGQNLSIAHVAVGSRAWGGRQRGKKAKKRVLAGLEPA